MHYKHTGSSRARGQKSTCSSQRIFREVKKKDFITTTSTRTKFLCADIFIYCVRPWFLLVIVVVDDEMEAMSRSSLCVQKRNENDSDISLSFSLSFLS